MNGAKIDEPRFGAVGGRHGKPRLIRVDAARAHASGIAFYVANRFFWLADAVSRDYLRLA